MDKNPEWRRARDLTHLVVLRHRTAVTSEVRVKYATQRLKRLEVMKKGLEEEGRIWNPSKEPAIWDKIVS